MTFVKVPANPFTTKPIKTNWTTSNVLLLDPRLRMLAGVSPLDTSQSQASSYLSPLHLNPGWVWCGGSANCSRQ